MSRDQLFKSLMSGMYRWISRSFNHFQSHSGATRNRGVAKKNSAKKKKKKNLVENERFGKSFEKGLVCDQVG
jgi:hypothetical protein